MESSRTVQIERILYKVGLLSRSVFIAALIFSSLSGSAETQRDQSEVTLMVVDPQGHMIACVVQVISPDGATKTIGDTDRDRPSLTISEDCKQGCMLFFAPKAGSEYHYGSTYCPYRKQTFVLQPTSHETRRLAHDVAAFEGTTATEAARLSLVANELADETKNKGAKQAYEFKSYVEAAKFLGAATAVTYDAKQKKVVPSTELEAKIEEFQRNNGIKQTGNLDYKTLNKASGLTVSDLRHGD